jgi:hypothetical protein
LDATRFDDVHEDHCRVSGVEHAFRRVASPIELFDGHAAARRFGSRCRLTKLLRPHCIISPSGEIRNGVVSDIELGCRLLIKRHS